MDIDLAFGLMVAGVVTALSAVPTALLWRRRPTASNSWLDAALFWLSPTDPFRIRDLLAAGVVIFGRAGSGKTSGSGRTLAKAIVGYRPPVGGGQAAGLICAAKPEELAEWQAIFAAAGRANDLLVFSPYHDLKCDFLGCVLADGGSTREVVSCMSTIGETLRAGDGKRGEDGDYWKQQQERLLYHAVCIVKLATGGVSAPLLGKFVNTAAFAPETLNTDAFREGFHSRTIEAAHAAKKSPDDAADFEQAAAYWLGEVPAMADRTRSSIFSGVLGLLHTFNSGVVRRLVASGSNVSPADILAGKWLIVDMSPTSWGEAGAFIQAGWKYLAQKAVLRRKAVPGDPFVVIWCDEAQQVLNSFDAHFAAQSRSHLGCMVCLTQSLHGVFAALKGESGKQQALAFLATMGTRIFHSLGSAEDAKFASELIGRRLTVRHGGSLAPTGDMYEALFGGGSVTASFNESVEPIVEPRVFMTGRTGGEVNGGFVDAIVVRSGEPFSNGEHHLFVTFKQ